MFLPLQKGIMYGPIDSRRLGKSLGINLMPCNFKLCSFNCVYCHYGLTDILTFDIKKYVSDLPGVNKVLDAIDESMRSSLEFDYITFSGNGEPTLHPNFCTIVKEIIDLRDRFRPGLKIALLSNSSGLKIDKIRKIISRIDLPVFKLDAGNAKIFKKINKPAKSIDFEEITAYLRQLEKVHIQTVLMQGSPSNVNDEELESYFQMIAIIKPVEVQIYSLDRPAPNEDIKRVLPEELERIASVGLKETGVKIRAFYL